MVVTERKKADNADEKSSEMKTVVKSPARLGADADLPLLEKVVYLVVYTSCFAYALYKIFKFPLDRPKDLYKEDFKDGWKFTGRKRDISDFEWQFWRDQFKELVLSSFLHAVGSRVVSYFFPQTKYRMAYFALYQLAFLWYSFGWKPMLLFCAHNVVYYIASRVKSLVFAWMLGLILLVSFVNESLTKWQFYKITNNANDGDFVLFTSLMCQLRGMSFCLDACLSAKRVKANDKTDEVSYGFVDLLGYNLYLPLLCNGPVVIYDDFYKQVNKPPPPLSKSVLLSFAWDAVRTIWWFFFMEFCFHYFYITSLGRDPYIIDNVSLVTATGLMYTLALLFCIKYVVFYRFAGMFARLDGINPPDIPKCVLNLYLFSTMWKYFDRGLHLWLMKYIYFPLGGSRNGILKQIISSVVTFAYVYYWHGGYNYLIYWAVAQWSGVFIEAMAGKLLKTKRIQHLENDILSPASTRRLHAFCGLFTITAAILSNCVFLVNSSPVVSYLKALFVKDGVWPALYLIAVSYCMVQVIMEVNQLEKQSSDSKKHS